MEFVKTLSIEATPAAHHRLLIDKLQQLAEGVFDNLMVFMPPGSAKSTYATVLFPPWFYNFFYDIKKNVLSVSYAFELAQSFGRRVRNIIASQEYYDITGLTLSKDSSAADQFGLVNGSGYKVAGAGMGITGFRADLGIIDDPLAGIEEANSDLIKKKLREWYTNDYQTRLKPSAKKLLIMTRWCEDDLAGWLLDEMKEGGEKWEILRLPFIAEANDPLGRPIGERLWKEWFTPLMEKIARRNERTFNALYQQRPSPLEGSFFKRKDFRFYKQLPKNLKYYMASDYAVTDGAGDWTVLIIFAVDELDNIYIIDLYRAQKESAVWVDVMCDMILRYRPLMLGEEKGVILKGLTPFMTKRMRERRAYVYRHAFPSVNSKEARASGMQSRMSMGMVFFPEHADWLADLVHELLTFPGGKNDDIVDALSLIGRMLDMLSKASVEEKETKTKLLADATLDEMWAAKSEQQKMRERI